MSYHDLREFIDRLETSGELLKVREEVDWKYEIAAWARISDDRKPRGPALLFEKIKDYPPGYSVFAGGLSSYRRMAIALGIPPETNARELITVYKNRISKPIKPLIVADGPVRENIHKGEDIDLLEFPIPWWTPRDGGRYIGTWHANVTKNPESKIRNLGIYRTQIFDSRHCTVGFLPHSHMGLHYALKERMNEPLEMALIIGADEAINMAAGTNLQENVDEYEVAGGLREDPVNLIKCETLDLEVPANAEIVIEGIVLPGERQQEGPFGEHTGYHGGGVRMRPLFQVTCIMHRNNPIFRGSLVGKPVIEEHIFNDIAISAVGLRMFEEHGPAGVTSIHCPPEADSLLLAIIQMKPYYVGNARDAARTWLSSSPGKPTKYVVVVDEDIDPFDLGEVWWAILTRTQGSRDIEVLPFGRASRSDPSIPRSRGEYTDMVIIDATKKLDYPYEKEWEGHWAPVCIPPKEIMDLANLKWKRVTAQEYVKEEIIERMEQEVVEKVHKKWEEWRKEKYYISKEKLADEIAKSYPILKKES